MTSWRSRTSRAVLLAGLGVVVGLLPIGTHAQGSQEGSALEVLHVQGNVYMVAGAGGNVTLLVGDQGVLVVDTGGVAMAEEVLAEIRKLSSGPIRYVINTHAHPDHTGGNPVVVGAGQSFRRGGGSRGRHHGRSRRHHNRARECVLRHESACKR